MADIFGSKRAFENLIGTAGDDRIFGLGGSEREGDTEYRGWYESDTLSGGGGNDLLVGGEGSDYIFDDDDGSGKYGGDTIFAGAGDDIIRLYGGADTVDGGEGDNDKVYLYFQDNPASLTVTFDPATGTFRSSTGVMLVNVEHIDVTGSRTGPNNLTGGNGNDRLAGGDSNDMLSGGSGNDTLEGGRGDDQLFGGDGNDVIEDDIWNGKTYGNDTIFAGDGNDVIVLRGGADTVDGGAGNDEVRLQFQDNPTSLTVTFDAATGMFRSSTGVVLVNVERIQVDGSRTGPNNLTGGNGNDELVGGQANDHLTGGNGGDHLRGGAGADVLLGGSGDDILNGGEGDDQLFGGDGNDSITDSDNTTGPYGNDTILAGGGDDDITLYGGADIVDGGAGNDKVRLGYWNHRENGPFNLTFDATAGTFKSSSGIILTNVEQIEVTASRGVDRLEGGKGNDRFYGAGKGDSVDGGAGDDFASIVAGEGLGNFTVSFNAATGAFRSSEGTVLTNVESVEVRGSTTGVNNLTGGNGNDKLTGGQKSDTLVGGNGNDSLVGGAGDDRLLGGSGNDGITDDSYGLAAYGNDTILAGDGDDWIKLYGGADMVDGGAGNDGVEFYFYENPKDLTITFDAATGMFQSSTGVILMNVEQIALRYYSGNGAAWIEGGNGNDVISSGSGDDFLSGGKGNDMLVGGDGNDILDGGDGDDILSNFRSSFDGGENTFTGGAGADLFTLSWNDTGWSDSFSFITDFSLAEDKIALVHPENLLVLEGRDFFHAGSSATNADQRILYNSETGMLSYDRDGNGSIAAVEIGQLSAGLALTADHFTVYPI